MSDASIVFEYLGENGRSCYKAIFHDHYPKKIHPALDVTYESIKSIPKLRFSNNNNLPNQYNKDATSIFASFNAFSSSNFIYCDGLYYHFKDTVKDIDRNNNKQVAVSNVIVQFVECIDPISSFNSILRPDKVEGSGSGLIFSGGKAMDFQWTREKDKSIQLLDGENNPLSLAPGHSWWILIDKKSSVAFN